jgi:hypothetical protein
VYRLGSAVGIPLIGSDAANCGNASPKLSEMILGRRPDIDDFDNLYVNAVWNDEQERGEVLLATRVDAGDRRVKLTANATAEVGSAMVHDEAEIIEQAQTTSSGDVTTEDTCDWDGCVLEDEYCNYCCGNWVGPTNYRISYACTDGGTVVETACYCYFDYSCCYDCEEDTKLNECSGCC